MAQGKVRDKKAHEVKIFEDVLSLCLPSGGQRAKVARKVEGDVDSSAESPDIRVSIAKRDAIVGIEHFRIDQNIKGGKKAESKDLETSGLMNKRRLEVLEMDDGPDRDAAMFDTVGKAAANYMQHVLMRSPETLQDRSKRGSTAQVAGMHASLTPIDETCRARELQKSRQVS